MEENIRLNQIKDKLNGIGCGFCLAKWTQVTLHLQIGRNHSCHHPKTHVIPRNEIKDNPSALHNTDFKKERRKEMLEGKRPEECDYCWNIEDNSTSFSDRIYKSSEPWSLDCYSQIKDNLWDKNFNPKYVEVSFSNICNNKCSYCGPSFSTQWVNELKVYGSYPTKENFNDLQYYKENGQLPLEGKNNPYVNAFWKWWPELYNDLHTFRITGGEPLLSKDTWKVLDYILETDTPNKELNIAINSNLGVSDKLIDNFIDKINKITLSKKVNSFVIYTSVDGWGKQAEYGRFGMNFKKFWDNINKILSNCPTVTLGIMCTYNTLSIPTFSKLIDEVFILKQKYGSNERYWTTPVALDCSYLRHPEHQTVRILPLSFAEEVKKHAELASKYVVPINHDGYVTYGFTDIEVSKISRIYDWMMSQQNEQDKLINQRDFFRFFSEHDRRRGTNFVETFPEYSKFFEYCKNINI